jgi:hypothetical protein
VAVTFSLKLSEIPCIMYHGEDSKILGCQYLLKIVRISQCCQNLPEAVRISQKLSESPRSCQNHPDAVRISEKLSEPPRSCQNLPEAVRTEPETKKLLSVIYSNNEKMHLQYSCRIYLLDKTEKAKANGFRTRDSIYLIATTGTSIGAA